ncbi:MAG: hypothetical protein Q9209_002367 [Squamulea sp. 1 TL-2023]
MDISTDRIINPQQESPLFNQIPPEVRNQIFMLALTAYEDPASRKYRVSAYYCRPGFTRALRIDTALLLTCRRVHCETSKLPASINEHTSWCARKPPNVTKNHLSVDSRPCSIIRRQNIRTVHVFAQQFWLEGNGFAGFTRLWDYACPTTLIITLRHSDWWWWESKAPLTIDPKQEGKASVDRHSLPSDPFAPRSWGNQFRRIKGLKRLELELETVQKKKPELDAIVDRANGWQFPLGDDRVLHLDKSKTKRSGWIGAYMDPYRKYANEYESEDQNAVGNSTEQVARSPELGNHPVSNPSIGNSSASNIHCLPAQSQAASAESSVTELRMENYETTLYKARERFQPAGVKFDDAGFEKALSVHSRSIYYVVTLTWEA